MIITPARKPAFKMKFNHGPFFGGIFISLLVAAFPLQAAEVPSFFGITPGSTTRAEVELLLGEPMPSPAGKVQVFEYQAPADAVDAAKVAVSYFQDTQEVSRLDVFLKTPLAAESLRAEFGRRSLVQDREDGHKEEFYYPRYQGFIFRAGETGEEAVAIVFLSPRLLSDLFVNRFNVCLGKKEFEQARLEAEKARLADPDNAEGFVAQGRYFYALKDYDQSLAWFGKALSAGYPAVSKSKAQTWVGFIHRHHKNSPEAALKAFQAAIVLSSSYAPAHYQMGDLLLDKKDPDGAAAEFSKALEIDPKYTQARLKLADYLYDKKQFAKALEHYETLSLWSENATPSEAPDNLKARLHFRHGYCLMESINELAPDYGKPIAAFERAVKIDPRADIFYENLGYAYEQKGDWANAEQAYLKSTGLKPDSVFSTRHLGIVLLELGRPQEALARAEKALSLVPGKPELMMDIARCHAALKKKGPARDWIRRAVQAGYSGGGDGLLLDPYFPLVFDEKELRKLLERKS
jgi:tetratricopeptide (TPR) repeat protein